ncbi:MAG TPA: DHA2 family efflux MFS transporter permease subunit [Stellaceae bacterium]|nr:DHA2 family efflux MFS transporter permease subunit [Stellaceae bacterium]
MAGAPHVSLNRGIVTAAVMLATIMQTLDSTIANVALPHMQGSFSVAQDEVTWVLTSYIVAAAIGTPLTGWLAANFGTKRLLLGSMAGFTIASVFCGLALSIDQMVAFRFAQGLCGAALVPLAQTMLLNIYPREKAGGAMAIWGAGVMLGPIIGPTLGGWLTDAYNWRWCFYINVPIGIVAFLTLASFAEESPTHRRGFDFFGFAMLSLAVGALQLMLDRGEYKDWLASNEIRVEFGLALAAFWVFLVHSATTSNPFVNLVLFKDRNFSSGNVLMFLVSVVILASTALLPTLLQIVLNYPVVTAGVLMTPRGFGTVVSMLLVGKLTQRFDGRLLMLVGFLISAYSFWIPHGWTIDMSWEPVAMAGFGQGLGLGMIFVPLSLQTFGTLPMAHRNEATALFSLVRNVGGSIGISLAENYLARATQASHQAIASNVTPYNQSLWDPGISAMWNLHTTQGLAAINAEVTQQASMIAYLQCFTLMAAVCVVMIPMLLIMRHVRQQAGGGGAAHAAMD